MQDLPAGSTGRRDSKTKPKGNMWRGEVQDQVLASLQRGLMVGAFVPGQVMSLRKLAAHLGTSPMPVRKALTQLVAANVLEALPNRMVRVPWLGERRLKELTDVRVAIEGMATRAACSRMTQERLDQLRRVNDELMQAIAQRDIVSCLATNQTFHFMLYDTAQSEVLMPLIEPLWLQSGPTMYFSLLAPNMPWDASAHGELLTALEAGDANAAQRAIVRDIRTTWRNVRKASRQQQSISLVSPTMDVTLDLSSPRAFHSHEGNGRAR